MHVGHCGNHIYIYKWCSHAAVAPSPGNFGMVAGLIECNQSCWAPACVSALSTADMASRALRFALRKALCSLRASRIGSEAVTPCSVCKVFTTALQKLFVKRTLGPPPWSATSQAGTHAHAACTHAAALCVRAYSIYIAPPVWQGIPALAFGFATGTPWSAGAKWPRESSLKLRIYAHMVIVICFFGVAGYSFGIQLLKLGISILSFFGRVIRETGRHFCFWGIFLRLFFSPPACTRELYV